MQIVKTNGNRTALCFNACVTPELLMELQASENNNVDVLLWWDETDQEYVLSPKWNRIKETTGEFNDLKKR